MPRSFQTALPSVSTTDGRKSGVLLYNEFAAACEKPLFDQLKPGHLISPKFRILAEEFLNWIANTELKTKRNNPYAAGTLAQYFSGWYNSVLTINGEDYRVALATDSERIWHLNMTSTLKRRLTDKNYNKGVNMLVNSTSCHRSTMVNLIRFILKSGGSDSKRQRDVWESR